MRQDLTMYFVLALNSLSLRLASGWPQIPSLLSAWFTGVYQHAWQGPCFYTSSCSVISKSRSFPLSSADGLGFGHIQTQKHNEKPGTSLTGPGTWKTLSLFSLQVPSQQSGALQIIPEAAKQHCRGHVAKLPQVTLLTCIFSYRRLCLGPSRSGRKPWWERWFCEPAALVTELALPCPLVLLADSGGLESLCLALFRRTGTMRLGQSQRERWTSSGSALSQGPGDADS